MLRVDAAQSYVHLRSLLWPGYVSYHAPGTRFFGGMSRPAAGSVEVGDGVGKATIPKA